MLKSHVIEVDGVFVGAAIQHFNGYEFVAVAPQLTTLNGVVSATLQEARSRAVHALRRPPQRDSGSTKPPASASSDEISLWQ